MTQLLQLRVTEPDVYTQARTQSYRLIIEALPAPAREGLLGQVDSRIFVVQEQPWGTIDFLRVVESRDLSLGDAGSLRRVDSLDLYVPDPTTAQELVEDILEDVRRMLSDNENREVVLVGGVA